MPKGQAVLERKPTSSCEPVLLWLNKVWEICQERKMPFHAMRDDEGWYAVFTVKGVGDVVLAPPAQLGGKARREQEFERLPMKISKACALKMDEQIRQNNGTVHYGR